MTDPDTLYLAQHIKDALATDESTCVLDIDVELRGGCIYLSGFVQSYDRRAAAERVAQRLAPPTIPIVNLLRVSIYREPQAREAND